MKQLNTLAIVLIVVGLGVGFFVGMKYQQNQSTNQYGMLGQRARGAGGPGGNQGLRPVSGEVLSSDEKSMTVKLTDGSSKIVLFSDSTTFSKSTAGVSADLTVGTKVAAFGTANSDGSISAQNIQVNPPTRIR